MPSILVYLSKELQGLSLLFLLETCITEISGYYLAQNWQAKLKRVESYFFHNTFFNYARWHECLELYLCLGKTGSHQYCISCTQYQSILGKGSEDVFHWISILRKNTAMYNAYSGTVKTWLCYDHLYIQKEAELETGGKWCLCHGCPLSKGGITNTKQEKNICLRSRLHREEK